MQFTDKIFFKAAMFIYPIQSHVDVCLPLYGKHVAKPRWLTVVQSTAKLLSN